VRATRVVKPNFALTEHPPERERTPIVAIVATLHRHDSRHQQPPFAEGGVDRFECLRVGTMAGDARARDAESTIARLEAEVETLRLRLEQNVAATCVCDALATAAVVEELAAPASHASLLEMVLETSASVISATAGALFLTDETANDLVVAAAIGGSADRMRDVRVPLGHGIAGGVALSGLPLAVTAASGDSRWAKDIGERVGYVPESIICVPLFYEDRIIGALELLDKIGAPSFTPGDLNTLGLFAHQAAVTIEQSRTRLSASALLAAAVGADDANAKRLGELIERDPGHRGSLELARVVREVALGGDRQLAACREILGAFAEYARAEPR
jgi:GAF domain-containing protein